MENFNIYMTGVGGQGIGMLSEVLLRAADYAGYRVKAVDTHGLAQRGGIVISHLRIGSAVHAPLIPAHGADLAVALERHEALRALDRALKDKGTLIYYDTIWQPLAVRLGTAKQVSSKQLKRQCELKQVKLYKVFTPELDDVRGQNVAVLAHISMYQLIRGITAEHYQKALKDLMAAETLDKNLDVFDSERAKKL